MAIKKRLLATAAIPLLALAGAAMPVSAAMLKPTVTLTAASPIVTVQSEEELAPKKHRKRDSQQMSDEENAEAGEEPARKNRKKQQQAEEQQQMDEATPADNAEAVEEPARKKRKAAADQAEDAQQGADAVSDDDIVNQGNKRKKQQQAEEQQQVDEVTPADNAEAVEEPAGKKRKNAAQAEDAQPGTDAVSDEDIVNQSKKRKKQQQAEEQQQMDEAAPADNAEAVEEPVRKKRKKDDQAEANTPEAIEKREEIAKDPSKTTDTVVLPVENGAAVLDSDKDADNSGADRKRRQKEREEVKEVEVPTSDKDAQKIDIDINIKPMIELKGQEVNDFRGYRRPDGRVVGTGDDVRVVFDLDGRIVIRSDDRDRIGRDEPIRYERLEEGRIKEIVVRPDGTRIVTIRNRWGEIIRRSRIERDDREIVIFYSPDLDRGRDRLFLRDPGDALPPMRLRVPIDDYIIDVSSDRDRDYETFLAKPPVERVERVYSVEEVKYSARIRDKVRRIDLDTITFETGSAEISRDQASTLREVAAAIGDLLEKDPGETFLIEGHTDAVGSDESNLVLSDERAESVANILSELFDIPAENLVTQGYGERYLKIDSEGPVRENRRVTIRRITPLVRPAEVSEN